MDAREKHPGEEVKRLQRCISDLISMMALPALWSGGDPSQIGRTLIDGLQSMLHPTLIYVQLKDLLGEVTIELARVAQSSALDIQPGEVGAQLNRLLGDDPQKWPSRIQGRFGRQESVDRAPAIWIAWRNRHARGRGGAIGFPRTD